MTWKWTVQNVEVMGSELTKKSQKACATDLPFTVLRPEACYIYLVVGMGVSCLKTLISDYT